MAPRNIKWVAFPCNVWVGSHLIISASLVKCLPLTRGAMAVKFIKKKTGSLYGKPTDRGAPAESARK